MSGESATGLAFVDQVLGLKDGPRLSILVRSTKKLPQGFISRHAGRMKIVEGSLTDEVKLNQAMEGVTTVVSFLVAKGACMPLYHFLTRSKPTPIADSFHLIKKSMGKHGVKRLLALSTPAHALPNEEYTWTQYITTQILPPVVVPQGSAEMTAIDEICADADFDYTIFRVPHLNESPADARVHAGKYSKDFKGGQELSRGMVAKWVYGEIQEK
ncbi:uncharacterized protein IL334_003749 [Kwoniella shivajii]|uniref:NAD(P)-binding domain-containing protein n=1 Tax=Kwoniella shivajii TaxID=564305 RepID=A0ABZ1D1E9_9TREE|nr:hypothetical protein IL334_003749 [Kwoniella shivajii]